MPHISYVLLAAPSCGATCSDRTPAVVTARNKRHTGELLLHSLPATSCKQLNAPATCHLCTVLPSAAHRTQRKDAGLLLPDTRCKQLAAASCCATCCLCNLLPIAAPRTQRKNAGHWPPDTSCKQLAAASCVATCCKCSVLPIAAHLTQRKAAACSLLSNGDRSFSDLLRVCGAIC